MFQLTSYSNVFRLRPENEKELGRYRRILKVLDQHVLIFDPADSQREVLSGSQNLNGISRVPNSKKARDYKYAFDRLFDEYTPQHEVSLYIMLYIHMFRCMSTQQRT